MQKHESLPGRGVLQELPLTIHFFVLVHSPTHSRAVLFLMFFLGKCLRFSRKLVRMQFCSKRTPCDSQKEIAYEHNSRRKHLKKTCNATDRKNTKELNPVTICSEGSKKNELTPRDWLQDTVWPRHSLTCAQVMHGLSWHVPLVTSRLHARTCMWGTQDPKWMYAQRPQRIAKAGTCFLRFGAPASDSALAVAHPRHARVNGKCRIQWRYCIWMYIR